MQQGMMAMFGMISQLYSHTRLAPQQPEFQGVVAPQLAVTPAPPPATTAAPAFSTTPEFVTNEFVQLNRSLSLIWSYVKRGPSISVILKGDLGFQLILSYIILAMFGLG